MQEKRKKTIFFWKFSRDGDYSSTYISFIIDVPTTLIELSSDKTYWLSSFNSLSMVLLCLQDVELFNEEIGQRNAGLKKESYVNAVIDCGFNPPSNNPQLRTKYGLVKGKFVNGRHSGEPVDWGLWSDSNIEKVVKIDVTDFNPIRNLNNNGLHEKSGNRDLLFCYRQNNFFNKEIGYWDLMPRHKHMKRIFLAMKELDEDKADKFVGKVLNWTKLTNK